MPLKWMEVFVVIEEEFCGDRMIYAIFDDEQKAWAGAYTLATERSKGLWPISTGYSLEVRDVYDDVIVTQGCVAYRVERCPLFLLRR